MRDDLAVLADHVRAHQDPKYCHDNPDTCDLCGTSFAAAEFLIDGEASETTATPVPGGESMGQWAYMCASCFASRGVGIKWGRGQLYQRTEHGNWLLVAGFPPDD